MPFSGRRCNLLALPLRCQLLVRISGRAISGRAGKEAETASKCVVKTSKPPTLLKTAPAAEAPVLRSISVCQVPVSQQAPPAWKSMSSQPLAYTRAH